MNCGDEREVDGGQAIVDVLLREQLGGEAAPDLTALVSARMARGDAVGAAARLAQAERVQSGVPTAGGRWLAAALLLLGLGVVLAVAMSRRDGRDGEVTPVQQPQQGQEPQIVQVQSLAQLQELLPQTVGMTAEFWQLPFCDRGLPVRMPPFQFDVETAKAFAAHVASDVRGEPPAGWKWTNRLRLQLRDGRAIELALAWHDGALERQQRIRIGAAGLQSDLSIANPRGPGAKTTRDLWSAALLAAQVCNGLMVRRMDLAAENLAAFAGCEALTLVPTSGDPIWSLGDIRSRDLAALATLPRLRRLDVSGLAKVIDAEALQHLAKITQLEELVLDGCSIDDDALRPIGQMPQLRALSLHGCANIRGNALLQSLDGAQPPALPFQALERLDLSDCAQVQDFVLPNLGAMPKLKQLSLADTPLPTDDKRWLIYKLSSRVERLDLSGHALAASRFADLADLHNLHELLVDRCGVDDEDLAVLARARGPLRSIHLGGNPAVTVAGAQTLLQKLPALTEVDLRDRSDVGHEHWIELTPGKRVWTR